MRDVFPAPAGARAQGWRQDVGRDQSIPGGPVSESALKDLDAAHQACDEAICAAMDSRTDTSFAHHADSVLTVLEELKGALDSMSKYAYMPGSGSGSGLKAKHMDLVSAATAN